MKGTPWETSYYIPRHSADGQWSVCEAGGGDSVAMVESEQDAEAIAHLIAAAPELLTALEHAVEAEELGWAGDTEPAWMTAARAAIAKAKP